MVPFKCGKEWWGARVFESGKGFFLLTQAKPSDLYRCSGERSLRDGLKEGAILGAILKKMHATLSQRSWGGQNELQKQKRGGPKR